MIGGNVFGLAAPIVTGYVVRLTHSYTARSWSRDLPPVRYEMFVSPRDSDIGLDVTHQ
jgi:hypothetical protein